jgi:hypothetical protein
MKERWKMLTPLKAIRKHCIDCSGFSMAEVKRCELKDCPLWPYRMGHNPKRKGKGGKRDSQLVGNSAIFKKSKAELMISVKNGIF